MPLPLSPSRALSSLLLCATAALLAAPGLMGQEARGPRERSIYVTVTGDDGRPVTGLPPSAFVVREDGRRREVLTAAPATGPATLALMVDNSIASEPFIADIRRGLEAFVDRMGGKHPMAVTTIGDRPTIVQDYTLDKESLLKGVRRIFPLPGSAAYFVDGVAELSRGLIARDFERAFILAILTEGPEFSDRRHSDTLPLLRESGAALEALVINTPGGPDLGDDAARSRSIILDRGTSETGGDRIDLLTSMAVGDALAAFAARVEGQYKVIYARPDSLIPPEKIEVSMARPGLTARGTPAKGSR
ncbi:MAG TPA: hypothetical protein PKK95_06085 [Vicinamibacterales bacterium]|nr:hypothetical protein [Acidobacteriota bacterium]HOC17814.1 hypothetical protein [Vicinamibacterales bacterium]